MDLEVGLPGARLERLKQSVEVGVTSLELRALAVVAVWVEKPVP